MFVPGTHHCRQQLCSQLSVCLIRHPMTHQMHVYFHQYPSPNRPKRIQASSLQIHCVQSVGLRRTRNTCCSWAHFPMHSSSQIQRHMSNLEAPWCVRFTLYSTGDLVTHDHGPFLQSLAAAAASQMLLSPLLRARRPQHAHTSSVRVSRISARNTPVVLMKANRVAVDTHTKLAQARTTDLS